MANVHSLAGSEQDTGSGSDDLGLRQRSKELSRQDLSRENVSESSIKSRLAQEEQSFNDSEDEDGKSCKNSSSTASDKSTGSDSKCDKVPDAIVQKWLANFDGLQPDTYWLTRIVLLRAIAFIYLVAFLVAYHQNKQLIGDRGLLPLRLHMNNLLERSGSSWWARIVAAPTILWAAQPWDQVDQWLDGIALSGVAVAAVVLVSGAANFFLMLALWLLYHSLVAVGQRWYGFGWESQLLETGLLMAWGVSLFQVSPLPHPPPSFVTIYGLRWLMFRIMLGAGLIKVRGDLCWKDLTCMNYHYQTQPVPNPCAYLLHHSPATIHALETAGNHVVELLVPWLVFGNRACRLACAAVQILFQVILIISGNLSFLNWLTIVPSLSLLDDRLLGPLFSRATRWAVAKRQVAAEQERPRAQPGLLRDLLNLCLVLLLAWLSLPVVVNLLSSRQAMNTSYDPFRVLNTYGAFGSITKERHEVILEGQAGNGTWLEYEFKCKPGALDRRPCIISPYHYRLDWLMWFAAMQPAQHNPWLFHLCYKLLANDPVATDLIRHNPFEGAAPPRSVRALLYKYQFTRPFTNATDWYTRRLVQTNYIPPLDNTTLRPMVTQMGWL